MNPGHPLDQCECGDYRRDHKNHRDACNICSWSNPQAIGPCHSFRLAKPFTVLHNKPVDASDLDEWGNPL